MIFLVSVSGQQAGKVIWSQNCASILGYHQDEDLTLDLLVPACFRKRHATMMRNLMFGRSMPRIFEDVYNMHIVSHSQLLLYGKWRIYLTNLKPSRDLAILATFQKVKTDKEFCVLAANGELQERTEGFQTFLKNSCFLSVAHWRSGADVVWEGIFCKRFARVIRSQWNLMNSTAPILTLHISELDTENDPLAFLMRSDCEAKSGVHFGNIHQKKKERDDKQTYGFFTEATTESNQSPSRLFDEKVREVERREARDAKLLMVGMGGVGVLSMVVSVVLLMVIQGENESFNATMGEINSMGLRRFLAVTAALRSKELYLISQGFQAFGNETQCRSDLQLVADQLKSMTKSILSGTESFTSDFESSLNAQIQPYWKYQADDYELRFLSTLDVMSELAASALVLSTLPLASISLSTAHFRNLYRNGLTTALPTFNRTLTSYISSEDRSHHSRIAYIQAEVLVCVFVLFVAGTACAVPLLVRTETRRRKLWKVLFALPRKAMQSTFENIATHMKDHHDIDDLGSVETNIETKRQPGYSMSLSKKLILLFISLHVSLSSGIQYVVYLQGVSNSDLLLSRKPWVINWAGLLRAESQSLLFYMRESWLQRNLPDIVANEDYNPEQKWMESVDSIKSLQWTLEYDPDYDFLLSTRHREQIQGNAAEPGPGPMTSEVCIEAMRLLGQTEGGEYREQAKAEKGIARLLPLLSQSVALYHSDSVALLEATELTALSLTLAYVLCSLLYLSILLPALILKVRTSQNSNSQSREIQLLLFLPKDSMLKHVLRL